MTNLLSPFKGVVKGSKSISLLIFKLGLIGGFAIGVYMLFSHNTDELQYDKYVFFINSQNQTEQCLIGDDLNDARILYDYYQKKTVGIDSPIGIVNCTWIPMKSKVCAIDTIENKYVLIEYEYLNKIGKDRIEKKRSYVSIQNIHEQPPFNSQNETK